MKRTGLIAKKLGMTSMFREDGKRETVTILEVKDCQVITTKTVEKDGYKSALIGSNNAKLANVAKPQKDMFAKLKIEPKVHLKEFRISDDYEIDSGAELKPSFFKVGQFIDVVGTSIGKGFAGVMKRHNFGGLEMTHGVSISHRSHGSTGQCQDPGKVFKNKKMAGHLGAARVTLQNLMVLDVDDNNGLLIVKGNVPGHKNSFIYVSDAVKKSLNINIA